MLAFAAVYAMFYLNDLPMLAVRGTYWVYVIDYVTRAAVIIAIVVVPHLRAASSDWGRLRVRWYEAAILTAIPVVAYTPLLEHLAIPLNNALKFPYAFGWLKIDQPFLRLVDLSFGLILVAISEELVCRQLARTYLLPLLKTEWATALVAAVVFGLMHWGTGIGIVVVATIMGLVFWWTWRESGSLVVPIIGHYFANLFFFMS
ncbi:MAG: CPBP family intramembrane metalloprotease [Alphaproteobacteria bacterium]|nr:CPBP family intramembrane metalloprotease [Alphaproteobacteria bacterium]